MITVPVPVMRGLLAQPRATVQVDRWNGRETEPAHGVKRQGPNGFPPTLILTDFQDTGTHNHQSALGYSLWPQRAATLAFVVMGPARAALGLNSDDFFLQADALFGHLALVLIDQRNHLLNARVVLGRF